jgi:hypothetical protein
MDQAGPIRLVSLSVPALDRDRRMAPLTAEPQDMWDASLWKSLADR